MLFLNRWENHTNAGRAHKTGILCAAWNRLCLLLRTFQDGYVRKRYSRGRGVLSEQEKVLPAKASSAAVVQYTAQRIAVGVYGTAGFLFLSLKNRQLLGKYHTYLPAGIGICILIAAVLLTISVSKTAAGCIFQAADRAAAKHPKWKEKLEKAREQTEILQQETRDLFLYDRKRLAEIFLCSLAKMTCWYLIPCVMLCGQNGNSFDTVLPLTAVSYMLSGVIPVPGGFGSVEGIFYLFFHR
ncbi:flippase-like domain-containing protein [Blautia sp. RD014234]|nr:flippase-like domain-containing protein [Blautia parvula]